MILEQHQTGLLECLGQMWTWVSGESVAVATMEGIWGDVEHIAADRTRTAIRANRTRTSAHADRERIEVKG